MEERNQLRKQEQIERLPALTGGGREGKEGEGGVRDGKGRTGGKPKPDIATLMLYEQ